MGLRIDFRRVEGLIRRAYTTLIVPYEIHNAIVKEFGCPESEYKIKRKTVCFGLLSGPMTLREYYSIWQVNHFHFETLLTHVQENHERIKGIVKKYKKLNHHFSGELLSKYSSTYFRYELLLIANMFHDIGMVGSQKIEVHGKIGEISVSRVHDKAGRSLVEAMKNEIIHFFNFDDLEFNYILHFPETHMFLLYKRFSEEPELRAQLKIDAEGLADIRRSLRRWKPHFTQHINDFHLFADADRGKRDER
jgi:hypothetical protein